MILLYIFFSNIPDMTVETSQHNNALLNFFINEGFQHICENIIEELTFKDIVSLRASCTTVRNSIDNQRCFFVRILTGVKAQRRKKQSNPWEVTMIETILETRMPTEDLKFISSVYRESGYINPLRYNFL